MKAVPNIRAITIFKFGPQFKQWCFQQRRACARPGAKSFKVERVQNSDVRISQIRANVFIFIKQYQSACQHRPKRLKEAGVPRFATIY